MVEVTGLPLLLGLKDLRIQVVGREMELALQPPAGLTCLLVHTGRWGGRQALTDALSD